MVDFSQIDTQDRRDFRRVRNHVERNLSHFLFLKDKKYCIFPDYDSHLLKKMHHDEEKVTFTLQESMFIPDRNI